MPWLLRPIGHSGCHGAEARSLEGWPQWWCRARRWAPQGWERTPSHGVTAPGRGKGTQPWALLWCYWSSCVQHSMRSVQAHDCVLTQLFPLLHQLLFWQDPRYWVAEAVHGHSVLSRKSGLCSPEG